MGRAQREGQGDATSYFSCCLLNGGGQTLPVSCLHPKLGCFFPKPHPGCVEERAARGHTPALETAPHGCPGPLRKDACRTQEAWDLPFGILNPRSPGVQELEISGSKTEHLRVWVEQPRERGSSGGPGVPRDRSTGLSPAALDM